MLIPRIIDLPYALYPTFDETIANHNELVGTEDCMWSCVCYRFYQINPYYCRHRYRRWHDISISSQQKFLLQLLKNNDVNIYLAAEFRYFCTHAQMQWRWSEVTLSRLTSAFFLSTRSYICLTNHQPDCNHMAMDTAASVMMYLTGRWKLSITRRRRHSLRQRHRQVVP